MDEKRSGSTRTWSRREATVFVRALKVGRAGVSAKVLRVQRVDALSAHSRTSLRPWALMVLSVFCSCGGMPSLTSATLQGSGEATHSCSEIPSQHNVALSSGYQQALCESLKPQLSRPTIWLRRKSGLRSNIAHANCSGMLIGV